MFGKQPFLEDVWSLSGLSKTEIRAVFLCVGMVHFYSNHGKCYF